MKTNNNIDNQSTVIELSRQEHRPITPLRARKNIPVRVMPTETTPKLICRYVSKKKIKDLVTVESETWREASEIQFNFKASDGSEEGPLTFVRFVWTDRSLFFYVEAEQTDEKPIFDNEKIWMGDNIEFLISPRWYTLPFYDEYEFLFNSQHGYNHLHWIKECDLNAALSWTRDGVKWQIRNGLFFHPDRRGWSMMGEILFSDFEMLTPLPGDYWGLGVFRKSCNEDGTILLQAWSPPLNDPPRFHTPSRFGMLVFTRD